MLKTERNISLAFENMYLQIIHEKFDMIRIHFKVILDIPEYRGKQKKAMRLRKEFQEYPNKSLEGTLMDKLKDNNTIKNFSIWVLIYNCQSIR
jgi:hypothetical protein